MLSKQRIRSYLINTKSLLPKEDHWTRGMFGRDKDGCRCSPCEGKASKRCLYGAMMVCIEDFYDRSDCTDFLIGKYLDPSFKCITDFNDASSYSDVIDLLDKAIKDLEE